MPGRGTPMPQLYDDIHDHIRAKNPTMSDSHIWGITVRAVAKGCLTGDVNFPGKQSMNPISRARYCAAYAQWKLRHKKSGLGGTGAPGPA